MRLKLIDKRYQKLKNINIINIIIIVTVIIIIY